MINCSPIIRKEKMYIFFLIKILLEASQMCFFSPRTPTMIVSSVTAGKQEQREKIHQKRSQSQMSRMR